MMLAGSRLSTSTTMVLIKAINGQVFNTLLIQSLMNSSRILKESSFKSKLLSSTDGGSIVLRKDANSTENSFKMDKSNL